MLECSKRVQLFCHSNILHERRKKAKPTEQNLHYLWQTFHMAKKMGESVGRSKILQRCLPKEKMIKAIRPMDSNNVFENQ